MIVLIGDTEAEEGGSVVFAAIRSDPSTVSLNTMLSEIAKLEAVRAVGLPENVFADVSPKIVAVPGAAVCRWSHRATCARHAPQVVLTLLAALLHCPCAGADGHAGGAVDCDGVTSPGFDSRWLGGERTDAVLVWDSGALADYSHTAKLISLIYHHRAR
ncbi:hypothetical protein ABZV91_30500 [Nocardia sp. NPDC004568]|uniref:hypothetical protein n=1 Tax=Nocardia sp. NPDC004568 TaxID=3154551 RepID=UPI0033A785E0